MKFFKNFIQDEKVGTAGTGKRKGRQLFHCNNGYAEFAPLETVILEKDFDHKSTETERSEKRDHLLDFEMHFHDESLGKSPLTFYVAYHFSRQQLRLRLFLFVSIFEVARSFIIQYYELLSPYSKVVGKIAPGTY